MDLGQGFKIGVDLPTPKTTTYDMAIKWDPLPYLVGFGKDWATMSKLGAVGISAALCVNPVLALACGSITNMILDGLGDTSNISNANQCYWMKNFNNPPEAVDAKECA